MAETREPICLRPGEGREYNMGPIISVFKADLSESKNRYSISEWWVDPMTEGAHPHKHDEDDIFFVIEGVMSFLINDKWIDAERGSFILAPGGVMHGFENRTNKKAAVLNISVPGGFEKNMSMITDWYQENPPRKLQFPKKTDQT